MALEDYNPIDYKVVLPVDENEDVSCPRCGFEEIYYHNGEYVCLNCECTLSEQEIVDYCGTDIYVLDI